MTARRWGLVGIAFLVGLGAGVLLFLEGSPVSPLGGTPPLRIEVLNSGPREADGDLSLSYATGGGIEQWSLDLPPGATVTREVASPPAGQLAVRLTAIWQGAADGGQGQTTTLVDVSDCGRGETMVVRFALDTTRGVSFDRATKQCE